MISQNTDFDDLLPLESQISFADYGFIHCGAKMSDYGAIIYIGSDY